MSLYIQIQRRGTCSFRHQINIQVLLCLTKNISEHTIVILPDTKGHERYRHNFASFCLSSIFSSGLNITKLGRDGHWENDIQICKNEVDPPF